MSGRRGGASTSAAASNETEGAALWSELRKLDPKAKRKDYINDGVWEIEDLRSDLQIEREQAAAMMAEHATQESQEPEDDEEEEDDERGRGRRAACGPTRNPEPCGMC